jgi:hypothetical protein
MVLLVINTVSAPFRGFSGGKLAAALFFAALVLPPLVLAALAYRNPERKVRGTASMNLGLGLLGVVFVIAAALAVQSQVIVPSFLVGIVIVVPAILNYWVLRERRAQPNTTVVRGGPQAARPSL